MFDTIVLDYSFEIIIPIKIGQLRCHPPIIIMQIQIVGKSHHRHQSKNAIAV
jgi:hypothetical protein